MEIANLIRKRRMERGLTVRALGKILGVSGSAITQWETGGNITWLNRVALSHALEIPITAFLPDTGKDREVSVKEPEEKLLLERFRQVSPKFREAYLNMLIVQGEKPDDPAAD